MTLLIFDCDGVLVDSELLHAQVETDYLKEKFSVMYEPREFNRRFAGIGLKKLHEVLEKEIGHSLSLDFDAELTRRKNEVFGSEIKPIPFVADILKELANIPRCVASNTPLTTVELSLKATGLYALVAPHIFSAQMVKEGKPAPDLFLYAARKMGATTSECIVIEDSAHGVKAAIAAGMRVFGFTGGSHYYSGYEKRLEGVEAIFSDMRELPRLL